MALETTLRAPIFLTDPLTAEPPEPAPGCKVCSGLMKQWREAMGKGGPAFDPSRATDLAVEIRRHPHGGKRAER